MIKFIDKYNPECPATLVDIHYCICLGRDYFEGWNTEEFIKCGWEDR